MNVDDTTRAVFDREQDVVAVAAACERPNGESVQLMVGTDLTTQYALKPRRLLTRNGTPRLKPLHDRVSA